jgi:hypothetical protein
MSLNWTMRIWKILEGKLPQKLGRALGGIIGSLGSGNRGECLGLGPLMELFCFVANSHMHVHTGNTANRSCSDFASNSCPMGSEY